MVISPNERLSHFIMRKNEVRPSDQRVKFRAFMPPKSKRLSVYLTSTLSEDEIWSIGNQFVARPQGERLYGRADILARDVYALDQRVEPETSIHHLHADIVPWPDKREDMQFLATELALRSKFIPVQSAMAIVGDGENDELID